MEKGCADFFRELDGSTDSRAIAIRRGPLKELCAIACAVLDGQGDRERAIRRIGELTSDIVSSIADIQKSVPRRTLFKFPWLKVPPDIRKLAQMDMTAHAALGDVVGLLVQRRADWTLTHQLCTPPPPKKKEEGSGTFAIAPAVQ